jgi:hypothetical protein
VLLTVTALLALRLYADHNLKLVARAISYTTEAAVVFHDEAARMPAGHHHPRRCGRASIYLPSGQLLASWSRAMTPPGPVLSSTWRGSFCRGRWISPCCGAGWR